MSHSFDVALSFAGEERHYVDRVAAALLSEGVRVFYDSYEEADLWGKDLYQHLSDIYHDRAQFCVVFASKAYAAKVWPRHELASAQARALAENREYILPARFDDTDIPGLLPTISYIDLRRKSPEELAKLIVAKVRALSGFLGAAPARASSAASPRQAHVRRAGQPARPWTDPSVAHHELLMRGRERDITEQLESSPATEITFGETDILRIRRGDINYYFQCERTYPNVTGFWYWDGSDQIQGVGNPDGSMWTGSDYQIGFFTLEHGKSRRDQARARITRVFETMGGRFPQKQYGGRA